jgi:LysM repeat protein
MFSQTRVTKEGSVEVSRIPRIILAMLALTLVLALAACEKPLQEDRETVPEEATGIAPEATTQQGYPIATQVVVPGAQTPGVIVVPTVAVGSPAPGVPTPEIVGAEPTQAPSQPVTYVVQPGDTLQSISQVYGVPVDALAAANGLSADAALQPGTTLIIPVGQQPQVVPTAPPVVEATAAPPPTGEQVHVVQAGENLFRIGLQYGIPYEEIAAYNNIPPPYTIFVGQEIKIPPAQ